MQAVNPLWDFNLPADSLATLPDDDFLAILHSQIADSSGDFSNDPQHYFLPQQDQDIPLSANPKSLIRPSNLTNTSPVLSDSSPSPPSGQEGPGNAEKRTSHPDAGVGSKTPVDDPLKRKASEDDDFDYDDAPPTHRSHFDGQSLPKAPSKRKGTGNPAADEQRLMKRKEQNRAAQRAFRERKERHVRDLEDQLSIVEARHDSAQAENDNLREMLRRLQAENTLLKQAAFTFSVPHGTAAATSPNPPQAIQGKSRSGSGSSSSSSNLFDASFSSMQPGYPAAGAVASEPTVNPSDVSRNFNRGQNFSNGADWTGTQALAPNAAFPSPFTIISSNPTYMSYRDPNPASTPFSSFMSPSTGQSFQENGMQNVQLQSFPQPQQAAYQSFLAPDVVMNDFNVNSSTNDVGTYTFSSGSNSTDGTTLDDLFGGQTKESSFSPYSVGTSPVSHPGSSTKPSPRSQGENGDGRRSPLNCSRQDVSQAIANGGPSPFVNGLAQHNGPRVVFEGNSMNFDGQKLPGIEKNDSNVDAVAAFKSLQNHPQFKDCDINGLCSEFAAKARCDGSRVVIPPNSMQELVESIPRRAQHVQNRS